MRISWLLPARTLGALVRALDAPDVGEEVIAMVEGAELAGSVDRDIDEELVVVLGSRRHDVRLHGAHRLGRLQQLSERGRRPVYGRGHADRMLGEDRDDNEEPRGEAQNPFHGPLPFSGAEPEPSSSP